MPRTSVAPVLAIAAMIVGFQGSRDSSMESTKMPADRWRVQTIRQLNGRHMERTQHGKLRIVTESWNRVAAVPYLVHMPEKDRLLMLISCDYPHRPMVMHSDDHGASWSEPLYVYPSDDRGATHQIGVSLTYLGGGKALLSVEGKSKRWFSRDYGETWTELSALGPCPGGERWFQWDPYLVDRDRKAGQVTRVTETGYSYDQPANASQGYIRSSTDEGRTWGEPVQVSQWKGVNEVALARAKNGDLIAACRTDEPEKYRKMNLDHFSSFGVSVSTDNGATWSELNMLYEYGRMHPSLVVMPGGDIAMTYVVRRGYTDDPEGYPRFGIEAVVSRDNGRTWDLDHRYILTSWSGNRKGPDAWWASSQSTSSVLLPDGSILTAFGTGYRSQPVAAEKMPGQPVLPSPRDIGLVHWRLGGDRGLSSERTISDAPYDSELRNVFDPTTPARR